MHMQPDEPAGDHRPPPSSSSQKTHDYKVINASLCASIEGAANTWAERGWRVVSVNIDTRQGYADTLVLERPVGVSHPDD